MFLYMDRGKRKSVYEHEQNAEVQIYTTPSQSLTHAFAIQVRILDCHIILLADIEGPLGLHCPHMLEDTFSHGMAYIV